MSARPSLAVWVAVASLSVGLGACGGDDESDERPPERATTDEPAETRERTQTGDTTETETETEEPAPPPAASAPDEQPGRSPEDQPGGAGDEEPARSQALFTGKGGRIVPRVVRVPAFIAIQVTLRSLDRQSYGLRFGRDGVAVDGQQSSASTTLDGLRPGEAIQGRPFGRGNTVRIEATAEPGP